MKENAIVLNIDKYNSPEEFWSTVSNILRILTDNDYPCVFRYEDCGNYVIEYNHGWKLGGYQPVWIDEETAFSLTYKDDEENDV